MSYSAVPALTSTYPDGTAYTRMAHVEPLLEILLELPFDEVLERCAISSRRDPAYLPSECLIHLVRSTRLDNRHARFNQLYALLLKRVGKALPRAERGDEDTGTVDASMSEINAAVIGRFSLLVTLDRQGSNRLDFYEVHFDEAIAKLRFSVRRPVIKRLMREQELLIDEYGELAAHLDTAAGSRDDTDDMQIFFDPIARPRLLVAIDSLPTEQKEVVTMTLQNIPGESIDPATPSISGILGCDPGTVRYRRARAVKTLRAKLGQEDGS